MAFFFLFSRIDERIWGGFWLGGSQVLVLFAWLIVISYSFFPCPFCDFFSFVKGMGRGFIVLIRSDHFRLLFTCDLLLS